jgi:hypothetical protein
VPKSLEPKDPSADVHKLQTDVKNLKSFIEDIEHIGGNVDLLKKSVQALEIAINTGTDIGDAAQETSQILKKYTDDLYGVCPKDDDEYVCLASIDRKWQARTQMDTILRRKEFGCKS